MRFEWQVIGFILGEKDREPSTLCISLRYCAFSTAHYSRNTIQNGCIAEWSCMCSGSCLPLCEIFPQARRLGLFLAGWLYAVMGQRVLLTLGAADIKAKSWCDDPHNESSLRDPDVSCQSQTPKPPLCLLSDFKWLQHSHWGCGCQGLESRDITLIIARS